MPGQVESDASIKFGSPVVKTNLELLQAVREQNPGAWVVYKPHPDVVAGLRSPGEAEEQGERMHKRAAGGGLHLAAHGVEHHDSSARGRLLRALPCVLPRGLGVAHLGKG